MKPEALTLRQLNRATLARQMLLAREPISAIEAIERLMGLQAQEPRHPFIGLWTRLVNFQRSEMHEALHDHHLVRATLMRGTLHTVTAADYAAFRATFQPILTEAMKVLKGRDDGLDIPKVLPVALAHLREQPRTFTELRALLLQSFPDVNERALGFTVRMHIPLVMLPTDARWSFPSDACFTPADTWLSNHTISGEDAARALALRYLAAFGPATVADFQAWSGLPGMKPLFESLRPKLVVFRDEKGKRELFDLPDAPRPPEDTPAPTRFLPEFDNLMLGHADRSRVIADIHKAGLVTKNGRVRATFLWDGFAAGFWEIERKKERVTLRLLPFEPLSGTVTDALATEGEALLRFVETDATAFGCEVAAP